MTKSDETAPDFTNAEELKLVGMSTGAVDAIEAALMPPPTVSSLGQAGFDGRRAMIIFNYDHGDNISDTKSCPITKASNQFIVAQAMFSRGKANRKVPWKELAGRIGSNGTKRKVKDAVTGINANIQKAVKVNDDLLVWEDGFVVRRI